MCIYIYIYNTGYKILKVIFKVFLIGIFIILKVFLKVI